MIHASPLLVENLTLIENLTFRYGVLDLACGSGRNGLHLARQNINVTFADYNPDSLASIQETLESEGLPGQCRLVDFEQGNDEPLDGSLFDACLVFNYLHRPLMRHIKECIVPGGLLFYETFTVRNRRFGRPSNPDFLLEEKELRNEFNDWDTLHYFEGDQSQPARAIAQLIARKP